MTRKVVFSLIIISVCLAAFVASCNIFINDPKDTISIEISGLTVNPIDIIWTIHDESGIVENFILDHPGTTPYTIARLVAEDEYGLVEIEIVDSGTTGEQLLGSGEWVACAGTDKKSITLNFDTQNPLGSSNYIFSMGDYLRDTYSRNYYIREEPTGNRLVLIYDLEYFFPTSDPSKTCKLYASNRSSITVTFRRNGIILHSFTGNTVTEAINMGYGSSVW